MRWGMITLGICLMIWGFVFDASVPTDSGFGAVMNLGLIAQKQMIFGLGGVLFLAGVVLVGAQIVADALQPARAEAPDGKLENVRPGYSVGPGSKKADVADGQY